MSDEFDEFIDWSKGDLLDACYDPAISGMGLDRKSSIPVQASDAGFNEKCEDTSLHVTTKQVLNPQDLFGTPYPATISYGDELSHDVAKQSHYTLQCPEVNDTRENSSTAMTERPTSPCRECRIAVHSNWYKACHAKESNHGAYSCHVKNCDQAFMTMLERDAHERTPHIAGHGLVLTNRPYECVECKQTFWLPAHLLQHGKEVQHRPYGCECGALFSRLDVLNRHLNSFAQDDPKYPCKYCKLHRGPQGFRRLDHLKQHIRNYHHLDIEDEDDAPSRLKYVFPVCPHIECPHYRDDSFKQLPFKAQAENKPFNSQSAYTKHMRDEHNECTFPCDVLGCARTGRRGYFREKDLLNHRRQEHPDAPAYIVPKRDFRIRCTEPGCRSLLHPASLSAHIAEHGWRLRWEERRRQDEAERQGTGIIESTVPQNFTSELMSTQPDFVGFPNDVDDRQRLALASPSEAATGFTW